MPIFGGFPLKVGERGYRPLVHALCFLAVWIFGMFSIFHILFYEPYTFLCWLFALAYTLILCYVFCNFLEHKSVWDLGLRIREGEVLNFVLGTLIGIFMITVVFLIEYHLKLIYVEANSEIHISYLVYGLLTSLSVALMEELVFRGYLFQNALLSLSENQSILLSSIIFGLMHIFNPNVNFLAIIVISVIGVLLAICYLRTQTLYLPIGIHFAWNYFEGFIYGFPISGNEVKGILITKSEGTVWLTGGTFGPEGGLIGLIVSFLAVAAVFLLHRLNKSSRADLLVIR